MLTYTRDAAIHRSPEAVFDFCSDLRNELVWNPNARAIELLGDGPVGVGTRYRAQWANTPPTIVDVVRYDPPRGWETRSNAMGIDVRFRGTVAEALDGARYTVRLELRPRGLTRLLAPLALLMMRRQEAENMRRIKRSLEGASAGHKRPTDQPTRGGKP